jgi:hypothetical protein
VSAASYTVRQLELEIGARLFNRTTRSVSVTEAGEQLMQRIAPPMEALQMALGEVSTVARQSTGSRWAVDGQFEIERSTVGGGTYHQTSASGFSRRRERCPNERFPIGIKN